MSKLISLPQATLLVALLAATGNAQNRESQRDIVVTRSSLVPAVSPVDGDLSLIPEMEGDDEFGEQVVIERTSNWYPFSIGISETAYRTTNANLATDGEVYDSYLRSAISLGYNPAIKGNWFADLGISEEAYRYKNLTDLDFDYQRAHAGAYYFLPAGEVPFDALLGNGFLFANYAWYNVSDEIFGPSVYTNHSAVLGFQKALSIKKGHQVYYGLATDLSLSSSSRQFQRNEHRIYGGYTVEWTEDLLTQAGYVGSLFDYRTGGQQDLNHTFEVLVAWIAARPTIMGVEGEVFVEGNAGYSLNDSNTANQDYEYFSWGGGVGFRTSF